MKKTIIYELNTLYRSPMRVTGYEFGEGEESVCVVGSMRGNEIQQLYSCSRLIRQLKDLEEKGFIARGHKILVIPCLNSYSMNIGKRFWSTDNTDINRMFPGYDEGETTQRIAAGVFDKIKNYKYGIQFASFYMPGYFLPHIRMMKTGFEDVEMAQKFGFPFVITRKPRPFDTTTLNYNWQIWETKAFSIYTTSTEEIDTKSAADAVRGILRMLNEIKVSNYVPSGGYHYMSELLDDSNLLTVRCKEAGIFESRISIGEEVEKGQVLANILDPYEGEIKEQLTAPCDGRIFFLHNQPLTYSSTAVMKLVVRK